MFLRSKTNISLFPLSNLMTNRMHNPCRMRYFKAYSGEFGQWRELKLKRVVLNMNLMLVPCKKRWLLDTASGVKKAFLFQMRECTFQEVVAMYYKEKLTFLPTVS